MACASFPSPVAVSCREMVSLPTSATMRATLSLRSVSRMLLFFQFALFSTLLFSRKKRSESNQANENELHVDAAKTVMHRLQSPVYSLP
jgi:hypothetical protein